MEGMEAKRAERAIAKNPCHEIFSVRIAQVTQNFLLKPVDRA